MLPLLLLCADRPPCERFPDPPSGESAVGWGFWEFYEGGPDPEDEEADGEGHVEGAGTWYRLAVYAYDPDFPDGEYQVRDHSPKAPGLISDGSCV
jgi:hypothetical protein